MTEGGLTLEIDKFVKAIANGDTAEPGQKTPFIKAKDAQQEMAGIKLRSDCSHQERGDALLRRILASLAKGRADDQKAVAAVAKQLVDEGMYGPGGVEYFSVGGEKFPRNGRD